MTDYFVTKMRTPPILLGRVCARGFWWWEAKSLENL